MKRKALIIDDDITVCRVLERILADRQLQPVIATDSRQGRDKCREDTEEIAIIYVDLLIPGSLSGWDIIKELKEREETAHIPIIVLTGAMISFEEQTKLEELVDAVIRKQDFELKSFGQLLDMVLARDCSKS